MEEEKKDVEEASSTSKREFFKPFYHCDCSRRKMVRCLLRVLIGLIIFSIGVCVGSHRGLENGNRFERGNFRNQKNGGMMQQWGGNRAMIQRGCNGMMRNNGFQGGNAAYQVQNGAFQVDGQNITPAPSQTIIKVTPASTTTTAPKK